MSKICTQYGNKIETAIFPKRILKTVGEINGAENLLQERELVVTFYPKDCTSMRKTQGKETYLLLDYGKELHGGVRLVIPTVSTGNTKIRLVFGESVSEALSCVGKDTSTNDHAPRDMIVDVARWSTLEFGQTGFRFVKIELLEDDVYVEFKAIAAISRLQDIARRGYFQSSDALLDEIVETAIYTAQVNMQDGVIWDGIKRDRLVWSGDLNTEILTIGYAFGDLINAKNSLEILRKTTPVEFWMNGIPTYSAWWIVNLFDYCLFTGDYAYVQKNIDYVNLILKDIDDCIADDGEMRFSATGKEAGMEFFLDWPSYEKPDAVIGTAALIRYTMIKAKKANVAGVDYAKVESIFKKLETYLSQQAALKQTLAMQIMAGANKQDGKERLEKDGAHGFTTFMSYFLLKALAKSGSTRATELAKEYYGAMLSRGATSFWEDFDLDWLEGSGRIDEEPKVGEKDLHADYGNYCYKGLRHSFCHGWSSGVVGYTFEEIVGIEIVEAGYKKVRITPNLNGLKFFKAVVPTPQGDIEIYVDEIKEEVKLPDGIERVY